MPRTQFNQTFKSIPVTSSNTSKSRFGLRKFLRKVNKINFRVLFLVLVLLGIGVGTRKFLTSDYFTIKSLIVRSDNKFLSDIDVHNYVFSQIKGKSIFNVDSEEISKALKNNFIVISDLTVTKRYPDTFYINILERKPVLSLRTPEGSSYFIDESGFVIGLVEPSEIPQYELTEINYLEPLNVGMTIDPQLLNKFTALNVALEEHQIKTSSVSFDSNKIELYTEGKRLILALQKDIGLGIRVFSDLNRQLIHEGEEYKSIDLRYDKVVVEY